MPTYDPHRIEQKWQRYWQEQGTFRAVEDPSKPKLYVLDMFPYPSGEGLHVGHPEGYTATDMWARYKRMCGYNVLHPMGYDAFGLPAEQYAIQTGTHPRITTERNIANIRRQIKQLGFSYDWDREFATTDPEYVKWTQWIFLVIYDTWFDPDYEWTDSLGRRVKGKGRPISELPIPASVAQAGAESVRRYQERFRLAYQAEVAVNWCDALGTVLADEEVINGRSERGDHPVRRIPLRQWMLRITAYADRLLEDLELLDWPDSIKEMQRSWIGRSEGAEVDFWIGWADEFDRWCQQRRGSGMPADPDNDVLRVYTTRPDTLFGATYMVLAPEHPLVDKLTTLQQWAEVDAYRERVAAMTEEDRIAGRGAKRGVFTGGYATNPVNGERIPVWIADYVLISYGTGAIMAVPAHDQRDFEFALKHRLPIRPVVMPSAEWFRAMLVRAAAEPGKLPDWVAAIGLDPELIERLRRAGEREAMAIAAGLNAAQLERVRRHYLEHVDQWPEAFVEQGTGINSANPEVSLNGQQTSEAIRTIIDWLQQVGLGRRSIQYKLRDWLFSRQRYWGEPFPILHEVDESGQPTGLTRPVPVDELPVQLPELEDFKPTGRPEPPLEKATDWLWVESEEEWEPEPGQRKQKRKVRLKRETNTMPQWAGSCWYYLRFCDPKNDQRAWDEQKERYWMPVDLYVGGAEHAVLHLLYARFWHKVLYDRGYVSTPEPFQRLVNQGMILSITYRSSDGRIVPYTNIRFAEGKAYHAETGEELTGETEKMSKARGNVIPVDVPLDQYGADTTRMYEMFMGPLEQTKPWSMHGVEGIARFLRKAWRMIIDEQAEELKLSDAVVDTEPTEEQLRVLHKTIKAVTEDIEQLRFNTAISRLMEFVNYFSSQQCRPRAAMESFVLLLSPLAPHIAEELWQALGQQNTLAYDPWPSYDEQYVKEKSIVVAVQVNGKVRAKLEGPADISDDQLRQVALADERVKKFTAGKQVRRIVVVPGRLVNVVVG